MPLPEFASILELDADGKCTNVLVSFKGERKPCTWKLTDVKGNQATFRTYVTVRGQTLGSDPKTATLLDDGSLELAAKGAKGPTSADRYVRATPTPPVAASAAMTAFMGMLDGTEAGSARAAKKYAAPGVEKKLRNFVAHKPSKPSLSRLEPVGGQQCYVTIADSDSATHAWNVCWSPAGKIVAIDRFD